MCGITGLSFVAGTNRNVAEKLQFAVTAISHRGPDDQGTFIDHVSGIALGHTRLSIQDLSLNGHQPMLTDDKRIALVFNGEIYNFRNLRADLVKAGHSFHSHSDTEVLLHLYIEHGESMLPMLNGIFAFALWDARIEKLLLARDALGVKPLYFHEGEDSFAFSSEVKSLREMIPGVGEIDHVSLH